MSGLSVPQWTVEVDGKRYEAEVAKVTRFHLGVEDHGLFTAEVMFEGASWGQGLASYALDTYDETARARIGTAFGADYIIALVGVIGSPETAAGRRVVVLREQGFGPVVGVAALRDDGSTGEPFIPATLSTRHFPVMA